MYTQTHIHGCVYLYTSTSSPCRNLVLHPTEPTISPKRAVAAIQTLVALLLEASTLILSPPLTVWLWGCHSVLSHSFYRPPQQKSPFLRKVLPQASHLPMHKGGHRGFWHPSLPEALVLGKGHVSGLKEMESQFPPARVKPLFLILPAGHTGLARFSTFLHLSRVPLVK